MLLKCPNMLDILCNGFNNQEYFNWKSTSKKWSTILYCLEDVQRIYVFRFGNQILSHYKVKLKCIV